MQTQKRSSSLTAEVELWFLLVGVRRRIQRKQADFQLHDFPRQRMISVQGHRLGVDFDDSHALAAAGRRRKSRQSLAHLQRDVFREALPWYLTDQLAFHRPICFLGLE